MRSNSLQNQQQRQNEDVRKLQCLRSQIYKPYKSVLSMQNQLQTYSSKNHSVNLRLKTKKNFLQSIDNLKNKKSSNLPTIKNKSLLFSEEKEKYKAITELVPDPLLNGRIIHKRQAIYANLSEESNQMKFLRTVEKLELEFLENCLHKKDKQSQAILSKLLNYSIDLNLIDYLCYSLRIMGEFNLENLHLQKSFFYLNQCRKCSMLIGQYQLMAECIVRMSQCTNQQKLHTQSIRLLKKAMQYVWYYDFTSLQLKIYDQIGKTYFMMGDAQNAKKFHHKYFSGGIQPKNSSIRLLSKQSLNLQGLGSAKIIRNISSVFLWMIRLPVKNFQQLSRFGNEDQPHESPRKGYKKDMKYYQEFKTVKQAVNGVLSSIQFKNQLGQMYLGDIDWTTPLRMKKFLSYDIQRNNVLKAKGISFQNYFAKPKPPKSFHFSQKLKKIKVKTEGNQQSENQANIQKTNILNLNKDLQKWFSQITSQTIKKYRNNQKQMSNKVCLRGLDKHAQPKIDKFRILYNSYFQYTSSYIYRPNNMRQERYQLQQQSNQQK